MPDKEDHRHITKEKLQSQLSRARMILRNEEQADRSTSESARHATRIIYRTEKFLGISGKESEGKDSPKAGRGSSGEKKKKSRGILPPLREITGKAKKTAALIGYGKRANKD